MLWFLCDLLTESVAKSVIAIATETEVCITHFYHDTHFKKNFQLEIAKPTIFTDNKGQGVNSNGSRS